MHDFALPIPQDGPVLAGKVINSQSQQDDGSFLGVFDALALPLSDAVPQAPSAERTPLSNRVATDPDPSETALPQQGAEALSVPVRLQIPNHPFSALRDAAWSAREEEQGERTEPIRTETELEWEEPDVSRADAFPPATESIALPVEAPPPRVLPVAERDVAPPVEGGTDLVSSTRPHTPQADAADRESTDTDAITDIGMKSDHTPPQAPAPTTHAVNTPGFGLPLQAEPARTTNVPQTASEAARPAAALPDSAPKDRQRLPTRDAAHDPPAGRATDATQSEFPVPSAPDAANIEPPPADNPAQQPFLAEESLRAEPGRGDPLPERLRADVPHQPHRTANPTPQGTEHVRVAQNGDGSMQLSLGDDEIGMIELKVHETSTGMRIDVAAERPESLDIARRQVLDMQRDLRLNGYGDVSFTFDGERRPQHSGRDPDPHKGSTASEFDGSILVTAASAPTSPKSSPTGLDLRL